MNQLNQTPSVFNSSKFLLNKPNANQGIEKLWQTFLVSSKIQSPETVRRVITIDKKTSIRIDATEITYRFNNRTEYNCTEDYQFALITAHLGYREHDYDLDPWGCFIIDPIRDKEILEKTFRHREVEEIAMHVRLLANSIKYSEVEVASGIIEIESKELFDAITMGSLKYIFKDLVTKEATSQLIEEAAFTLHETGFKNLIAISINEYEYNVFNPFTGMVTIMDKGDVGVELR